MKAIIIIIAIAVAVAVWRVAPRLSADALSMAIGVLIGVCAPIPALLAFGNRHESPPPVRYRIVPPNPQPAIEDAEWTLTNIWPDAGRNTITRQRSPHTRRG